jgi:hypothetical protein
VTLEQVQDEPNPVQFIVSVHVWDEVPAVWQVKLKLVVFPVLTQTIPEEHKKGMHGPPMVVCDP